MSKDEIIKELEDRPRATEERFVNEELEFWKSLIEIVKLSTSTGFKDHNGKEIKEGDTLEWITVRGDNKYKKEIVKWDAKVGAWYCGSDLLSTVLWEQNNDVWKANQHYEIKEKQYARIIEVTK